MLKAKCSACNAVLSAPMELADKTVKCPKCQALVKIPGLFSGETEPVATTPMASATAGPANPPPVWARESAAKTRRVDRQSLLVIVGAIAALVLVGVGVAWWLFGGGPPSSKPDAEPASAAAAKPVPAVESVSTSADIERLNQDKLRLEKERLEKEVAELRRQQAVPTVVAVAASAPALVADQGAPAVVKAVGDPNNWVADQVDKAAGSVVVVATEHGFGAGFVAFEANIVITNYHVVSGAGSVTVRYRPDTAGRSTWPTSHARVIAVDTKNDLAVVEVQDKLPGGILPLADALPRVGAEVIAIGNPGLGATILSHTVSTGIISSADREIDGHTYMQTTAAINPGNSGGPLLDREGRVVGVVSAKSTRGENIGFAVPTSLVKACWEERNGKFKVPDDFKSWDQKQTLSAHLTTTNTITLDAVVVDMVIDPKRNFLYAVATDKNRLYAINLASHKVEADLVVGSEPHQIQFAPGFPLQAWVCCRTSKSFNLVNLDPLKQVKQVQVSTVPIAFTLAGENLWFIDDSGGVSLVRKVSGKERKMPFDVRSIVYHPGRGKILCGAADSWLWEIDHTGFMALFDRLLTMEAKLKEIKDGGRLNTNREIANYNAMIDEYNQGDAALWKYTKKLIQPGGTPTDFSTSRQGLILDPPRNRIYFNRAAVSYSDPSKIIGVFQHGNYSRGENPQIKELLKKYPWFDQIRAVSPDGKLVASGTYLYRADDFTVITELPVPATAVAFSPDGKQLIIADPFNSCLVALPLDDATPKDPAKDAPKDAPPAAKPPATAPGK